MCINLKSLSLSRPDVLQITYLALVISGPDERQRSISARVSNSIVICKLVTDC